MHKYNKLRRIVRAKQGSQIPKLYGGNFIPGPGGMMQDGYVNRFSIGSQTATTQTDATDFSLSAESHTDELLKKTSDKKSFIDTKFGKGVAKAGDFVGNLIMDNSEAIMNGGASIARNSVDIQGKGFSKFDKTTQDIAAFGKQIGGPAGGLISTFATGINTWGNVINALGARRLQNFSVNKDVQARVGSSYNDSYADITKAGNLANKKVGLFGGAGSKNNFIDDQRIVQGKIARIDAENQNLQAMAGNNLNYLGHQIQQDGGYDQFLMGIRAKQGGILQKINLVKSKRLNKDVINLNTKEIEQVLNVEEFKEGGSIQYNEIEWEPIIDDAADYWEPVIDDISRYKEGGSIKEELETPEIDETNQKNLIPEGALHKNKHHMEHTEGLTQKGIPVIDNDGEQQAEIELDEIIFTLEVTKKLEELYKDGSDKAAIEAGKLLVKEILFNTDDRTGLIAKCEKGGKL